MAEFPKDITIKKIERAAEDAGVRMLTMQTVDGGALATGIMKIVEPATGIVVSAGDFKGQKEYDARIVAETGLIIELRLHGQSQSQELDSPGRRTVMGPGDMLLSGKDRSSPWDVHAEAQGTFETVSIRYSKPFLTELAERSPELSQWALRHVSRNGHLIIDQTAEIAGLARQLLSCVRNSAPDANLILHSLALRLMAAAWRHQGALSRDVRSNLQHRDVIAFAVSEIEKNPHASLTVKSVAGACRMSQSSMKLRFKQVTGRSIGAFIIETRMTLAAEMLAQGVSVNAAAKSLGYASAEAFSRAVKKHFGRPPRNL